MAACDKDVDLLAHVSNAFSIDLCVYSRSHCDERHQLYHITKRNNLQSWILY